MTSYHTDIICLECCERGTQIHAAQQQLRNARARYRRAIRRASRSRIDLWPPSMQNALEREIDGLDSCIHEWKATLRIKRDEQREHMAAADAEYMDRLRERKWAIAERQAIVDRDFDLHR